METNRGNYPRPIPESKVKYLTKLASKSVCIVETEENVGSAGFYVFEATSGTRFCLISCHHVLSPEQVLTATFQVKGYNKFSLKKDWIGQISFKPKLLGDFTVVELMSKAINILKKIGVTFLRVSETQTGDQFIIIQYLNMELCLGQGSILAITGFSFEYYAPTDYGSSGSPLLRWSGEAIGVHRGRSSLLYEQGIGPKKVATCLTKIIRYFLHETQQPMYSLFLICKTATSHFRQLMSDYL